MPPPSSADGYDSSDEEIVRAPNPYASAGDKSIAAMIERAAELRQLTKANYESSKDIRVGAPTTIVSKIRWENRFKAYLKTCNYRADHVPTGEDIHCFMDAITQVTKPRSKDALALSYSWYQTGLSNTIEYCEITWDDFQIKKTDNARLRALAYRFLETGVLTKDPQREKQWLECRIVQRAASLVVISALGRGGDVLVSSGYTEGAREKHNEYQAMIAPKMLDDNISREQLYKEIPCLIFEDITIKVVHDESSEISFVAEFVMCQDKGEKASRKIKTAKRTVRMKSQQRSVDHSLDVIKYILILALRFGVVVERSIEDLIKATSERRDRIIQWVKPKAPVFPAFLPYAAGVDLGKAASENQALVSLRLSCDLAGITASVVLHDLRRGAADDITYLPDAPKLNVEGVAQILGHNDNTMRGGVTRDVYMGRDRRDIWSERVQQAPTVEDAFGIEVIGVPFQRKRKYEAEEVRETCDEHGFDYSKPGDRRKASDLLVTRDKTAFFEEKRANQVLSERSANVMLSREERSAATDNSLDPKLRYQPRALEEVASPAEAEPDPKRTELDLVHGTQKASEQLLDLMDPLCEDGVKVSKRWGELVEMSGLNFISTLSKINVVRAETTKSPGLSVHGGSRDEPSIFQLRCPNHIFGCLKKFDHEHDIRNHWPDFCKSNSFEAHLAEEKRQADVLATAETFECTQCKRTFTSLRSLRGHKTEHSEQWVPKKCDIEGCKSTVVFTDRGPYMIHLNNQHDWKPIRCPLHESPECTEPERVFTSRKPFKRHLEKQHDLTKEELREHMPVKHGRGVKRSV